MRVVTPQIESENQNVTLKSECYKGNCRQAGVYMKIGYLKDTFHGTFSRSRKQLFLASVLFVNDMGTVEARANQYGFDPGTMSQWDQWFRDVIIESFTQNDNPTTIGGLNTIVEVDETPIVRRKYQQGRLVGGNGLLAALKTVLSVLSWKSLMRVIPHLLMRSC